MWGETKYKNAPVDGLLPLALVDQLVPLRDEVVDGAARVRLAEGRACVFDENGHGLSLVPMLFLKQRYPLSNLYPTPTPSSR